MTTGRWTRPLTRHALRDGFGRVIAVGGDGTINEVVNGFFQNGIAIKPEAELALLTYALAATSAERRDRPDVGRIAREDRNGRTRQIDVGRLTFVSPEGKTGERYLPHRELRYERRRRSPRRQAKVIKRLFGASRLPGAACEACSVTKRDQSD